jgi:hypothetical protein
MIREYKYKSNFQVVEKCNSKEKNVTMKKSKRQMGECKVWWFILELE